MRTSASRSRASRSCSRARSRSSCWATNWERVGREPSGNAFNSLVQLERARQAAQSVHQRRGAGRHRRVPPLREGRDGARRIRAAADRRERHRLRFARRAIGAAARGAQPRDGALHGELRQHADATRHGDRRVLPPVRDHDELRRAARAALFLANGGVAPVTGERIVDSSSAKRLSALMLTCGTYDAAGISCIASGCLRKAVSAAGSSRCCRARWPCACGRRPMRTGTRWRGRWRWSG